MHPALPATVSHHGSTHTGRSLRGESKADGAGTHPPPNEDTRCFGVQATGLWAQGQTAGPK